VGEGAGPGVSILARRKITCRVTDYRFIFDNNCEKAAEYFPKRRTITLKQARVSPDATDREIVEVASDRKWIIVTSNGDDFIAEIKRYLAQSTKLKCHDLAGLVILPSAFEAQRNALHKAEQRLVFNGRHLSWKDVWELNCCVRLTKTGDVQVTRFERCFYCKKAGVA
jgi:predicted nuclease of predicted toxin-antitoxin system